MKDAIFYFCVAIAASLYYWFFGEPPTDEDTQYYLDDIPVDSDPRTW